MQAITLTVAIMASGLVFLLAPIYGLIVYVATFSWYPTYLSVPVGTIDFTARRIVILAIFAKLFLQTDLPNRFRFIWLDKLVIIYFAAQLLAGATTATSLEAFIENRSGAIFDTVLPYFAVRIILKTKEQYLILLKAVLCLAVPLACLGLYQSSTGHDVIRPLKAFCAWGIHASQSREMRHGFYRADVTFPQPIMFGLFFAMFGPTCAGILRSVKKYKKLYWMGLGLMGVGVFSSMSGGPWLATLLAVSFVAFYRWRRHWKLAVIVIIVMCGLVETISNVHFYDVLGRYTFNPGTAWYRRRLVDVALFEGGMSGHWWTGFGYNVDPGWYRKIYDFELHDHTDVVNHYLLVLGKFGLIGFVPFLAMNLAATKRLVAAYKASTLDSDKWLIWCLSAGMFGLALAFMTVSIYGPPITVYYMMIGFAGIMPEIVTRRASLRAMITDAGQSYKGKSMPSFNGSRLN